MYFHYKIPLDLYLVKFEINFCDTSVALTHDYQGTPLRSKTSHDPKIVNDRIIIEEPLVSHFEANACVLSTVPRLPVFVYLGTCSMHVFHPAISLAAFFSFSSDQEFYLCR